MTANGASVISEIQGHVRARICRRHREEQGAGQSDRHDRVSANRAGVRLGEAAKADAAALEHDAHPPGDLAPTELDGAPSPGLFLRLVGCRTRHCGQCTRGRGAA